MTLVLLSGVVVAAFFLAFAVTLSVLSISLVLGIIFGRARVHMFVRRSRSRSRAELLPEEGNPPES